MSYIHAKCLLTATVFAPLLLVPMITSAQTEPYKCQPGERRATPADVLTMKNAGIYTAAEGMCWNPESKTVGKDVSDAKAYLNSLPNKCVGGCQAPPTKENIDKLDNTFAICAANFFKEYQAKYGPVSISSAFRCGPLTPSIIQCDRSVNGRAGGAKTSNHQLGLAIDVNPAGGKSSYETMWSFSKANPQLGICFPHQDGRTATGYPDRPHMILAGTKGGEGSACAQMGITKPCNGLPTPTVYGGEAPNSPYYSPGSPLGSSVDAPQSSAPSSYTPAITAALTGALRSLFGMQQEQPPQPAQYMQQPSQSGQYGQTSQPYSYGTDQGTQNYDYTPSEFYASSSQYQQQSYGQDFPVDSTQSESDSQYASSTNVNDTFDAAIAGSQDESQSGSDSPIDNFIDFIKDSFFPSSPADDEGTHVTEPDGFEDFYDAGDFAQITGEEPQPPGEDGTDGLDSALKALEENDNNDTRRVTGLRDSSQSEEPGIGGRPSVSFGQSRQSEGVRYATGTVRIERPSPTPQTFDTPITPGEERQRMAGGLAERDSSEFTGEELEAQGNILAVLIRLIQPFRGRDPHVPVAAVE